MNEEASPRLQPIAEVNQLELTEFANALRPLFEAAGPMAEPLHAERPFASYADLLDRAESIAGQLPTTAQIEVVSAHPRIGESADAVRQTSALSYREQGFDAEACLPPDEVQSVYAALAALNRAYEERFGFRFVVFVNGRPKSAIVGVMQKRLSNSPDEELETSLRAMFLIARARLSALNADC